MKKSEDADALDKSMLKSDDAPDLDKSMKNRSRIE